MVLQLAHPNGITKLEWPTVSVPLRGYGLATCLFCKFGVFIDGVSVPLRGYGLATRWLHQRKSSCRYVSVPLRGYGLATKMISQLVSLHM